MIKNKALGALWAFFMALVLPLHENLGKDKHVESL